MFHWYDWREFYFSSTQTHTSFAEMAIKEIIYAANVKCVILSGVCYTLVVEPQTQWLSVKNLKCSCPYSHAMYKGDGAALRFCVYCLCLLFTTKVWFCLTAPVFKYSK